ncbi:MAG: VWA domain-containing protein [Planctomycetales bacterium]|nr:VWA domain-containing protein [Planctomycetales bacterium]
MAASAFRPTRMLALLALASLFLPAVARAQGVLIDIDPNHSIRLPRPILVHIRRPSPAPQPPESYKIKELAVDATLKDQVAKVQVSQSFVNTGSRQMEVCFVFPLPYDGAVDRLTLLVDGKEFPAKLMQADEARSLYESIVRKNKDPALLEWLGAGLFKTSVFPVPPGAERKVTLRYSQICRKNQGLTEFVFPLSTAKYTSHPVESVRLRVAIESASAIKNIYSPTHAVGIKRPGDHSAVAEFERQNEVPTSDFRLFYDVGKGVVGTSVISYRPDKQEDGYFLLLASPKIEAKDERRPAKTVVFVVDRSGSMSGKKIEQAKGALKFVLNNLRKGDLFNIVAYDSEVESFRPELQKFDEESRSAAFGFVEGIYAGGSTNIEGALKSAFGQLTDSSRPTYVIFLTDGLPTVGETNEAKIVASAEQANNVHARLFSFGVGYDVNSRLLDKLVRANFGQSDYVSPDEDIEAKVSQFYQRIGAPVMTGLDIQFDLEGLKAADGKAVNRVYPRETLDLFAGEQLVLVGRYKKPGDAKVTVRGRVGDHDESFDFPAKLVKKSNDETNAFVEKLWAMRRVGEIIDELDLKGKNDELVKELVELATKHGILTPYTSFLADENANLGAVADNRRQANERLDLLERAAGESGFAQRKAKAAFQNATEAPAAADASGRARYFSADEEKEVVVDSVRNLGSKTFYRRDDRWVESRLADRQDNVDRQSVARYSDEYFRLVREHGKQLTQYLILEEPVELQLGEQVYLFE